MNIKDFKVGDNIIVVITERDYTNGGTKDRIDNEKVISVGRKYVHVTRYGNEEFTSKFESRENLPDGLVEVVNVGTPARLFKSIEDYKRHVERKTLAEQLYDKLCNRGELYRLSYEQLITILTIIKEET